MTASKKSVLPTSGSSNHFGESTAPAEEKSREIAKRGALRKTTTIQVIEHPEFSDEKRLFSMSNPCGTKMLTKPEFVAKHDELQIFAMCKDSAYFKVLHCFHFKILLICFAKFAEQQANNCENTMPRCGMFNPSGFGRASWVVLVTQSGRRLSAAATAKTA